MDGLEDRAPSTEAGSPEEVEFFGGQARVDLRRVAAQEAAQAFALRSPLRVGPFAAVKEVVGAGGRSADRVRLGEAVEGLLVLLALDTELDH